MVDRLSSAERVGCDHLKALNGINESRCQIRVGEKWNASVNSSPTDKIGVLQFVAIAAFRNLEEILTSKAFFTNMMTYVNNEIDESLAQQFIRARKFWILITWEVTSLSMNTVCLKELAGALGCKQNEAHIDELLHGGKQALLVAA